MKSKVAYPYYKKIYFLISGKIGEHACTTISCGSNEFIDITYAFYGIQYWCDASNEVGVLDGRCYGKQSCQVCATNSWYGDPCGGTVKYLWYNYDCKSKFSTIHERIKGGGVVFRLIDNCFVIEVEIETTLPTPLPPAIKILSQIFPLREILKRNFLICRLLGPTCLSFKSGNFLLDFLTVSILL